MYTNNEKSDEIPQLEIRVIRWNTLERQARQFDTGIN